MVVGTVVSNASNVLLLDTAVKAAPAALAVPKVNAGAASSSVLGIGVTVIPITSYLLALRITGRSILAALISEAILLIYSRLMGGAP